MERTLSPEFDALLRRVLSRPRTVLSGFAVASLLPGFALLTAGSWGIGGLLAISGAAMGGLSWKARPQQMREYRALVGAEPVVVWLRPWEIPSGPLTIEEQSDIDWSVEFEFPDGTTTAPGAYRLRRSEEGAFLSGMLALKPVVPVRLVDLSGIQWRPTPDQPQRRARG